MVSADKQLPPTDQMLGRLAEQVAQAAHQGGWRIAVAESCTGGWLARCFTDLPGSSEWFEGGWVVYSNALKQSCLGVCEQDLYRHGAVSQAVVETLAHSARRQAKVDLAVAISGVAGPGGGSADKPVGTVWFSWTGPGQDDLQSRCLQLPGDRDAIRRASVAEAMTGLLRIMQRPGTDD